MHTSRCSSRMCQPSQQCPVCGFIHKENRKTQSQFKCIECGYECNADENAARNIKDRVFSEKLCEKLLKRTPDGYVPKTLSHDKVLDILMEFSCNAKSDNKCQV